MQQTACSLQGRDVHSSDKRVLREGSTNVNILLTSPDKFHPFIQTSGGYLLRVGAHCHAQPPSGSRFFDWLSRFLRQPIGPQNFEWSDKEGFIPQIFRLPATGTNC